MEFVKISFTCIFLAFLFFCNVAASDAGSGRGDAPEKTTVVPTTETTTNATVAPTAPTTAAPTSNTTLAPTVKPTTPSTSTTPSPAPPSDVWTVTNGTEICIMMKSKAVVKVTYVGDNKTQTKNTTEFNVPNDAKVAGSCGDGNSSQYLELSWTTTNTTGGNSIRFTFNKTEGTYYVENVKVVYQVPFVKANQTVNDTITLNFNGKLFSTTGGNSYTCTNPPAVNLAGSALNATGELSLHSLQYEAYGKKNGTHNFSSPQDCLSEDGTPDIIPILVAGALILLVVVVLVAYVITRRRSQARGYMSM